MYDQLATSPTPLPLQPGDSSSLMAALTGMRDNILWVVSDICSNIQGLATVNAASTATGLVGGDE